jgi:hypothetical protein
MSLLDDLRHVGERFVAAELPSLSELPHITAAIVKVLEHAGITVADDLLQTTTGPGVEEAAAPVIAEGIQAGGADLDRLAEQIEQRILQHLEAQHPGDGGQA